MEFKANISASKLIQAINFNQTLFRVTDIAYTGERDRPFQLTLEILRDGPADGVTEDRNRDPRD